REYYSQLSESFSTEIFARNHNLIRFQRLNVILALDYESRRTELETEPGPEFADVKWDVKQQVPYLDTSGCAYLPLSGHEGRCKAVVENLLTDTLVIIPALFPRRDTPKLGSQSLPFCRRRRFRGLLCLRQFLG